MKTGKVFVYGGSAMLLAIMAMSSGCKGPEVMQQRAYIPAPSNAPTGNSDLPAAKPAAPEAMITPAAPVAPVKKLKQIAPINEKTVATTKPSTYPPFQPIETTGSKNHEGGSTYTIKKGDSLWVIAKRHSINVSDLAAYNNMTESSKLVIGKTIKLPPGSIADVNSESSAVKAGIAAHSKKYAQVKKVAAIKPVAAKAPAKAAKNDKADKADKAVKSESTEETASAATAGTAEKTYVVKKGDNWGTIARKLHVKSAALAEANKLKVTDTLHVGQKLAVPAATAKAEKSAKGVKEAAAPEADAATTDAAKATAPAAAKTGEQSADEIIKSIPDEAPKSLDKISSDLGGQTVKTKSVEVQEDTTVDQFAAKNGVKADDIRKNNPEINADGKLKKGDIVTIPE